MRAEEARTPSVAEALASLDQLAARREWYVTPPPWLRRRLLPLLVDERDAPVLYAALNAACVLPPAAAALLLAPPSHALGAACLALSYALFLQRTLLALHFAAHRRLFRSAPLNALLPALAALLGLPAGLYSLHHCAMHHGEGNGRGDLSSTERSRRDSPAAFLRYWLRFALAAWLELPLWALRRRRHALAARALAGCAAHWALYCAASRHNATAALWLFPARFALTSLLLMFGNWSQHAFVAPERARRATGSAYTCLAHADNQSTFNDGYHASHHANARAHWSELPAAFLASLPAQAAEDALVFRGVHFFDVGVAVLLRGDRGLAWLAERYVQVGQPPRSQTQLIAELRRRLAPL